MASTQLITHLERKGYKQLLELQRAVDPIVEQYDLLFSDTNGYMTDNVLANPEDMLNVMDAFNR